MSAQSAESDAPTGALTAAEKADLFNAACRAHRGPETFVCRPCADVQDAAIERVIAVRVAAAKADGLDMAADLLRDFRETFEEHERKSILSSETAVRLLARTMRATPPAECDRGPCYLGYDHDGPCKPGRVLPPEVTQP